ncbi:pantetheinase [Caerostris darwini]|uniref:Pantetheinase n=1 Tax=Caerostris darwini TaxID=1538125 RepID=A0AAV4W5J4_9ARAC|nr:pantetheinase [Caerostris darwini]
MLFSLTILHMSITGLNGHKFFYRAAVFEIFQFPNFSYPGSEIISKNLEKYELAAEISADNVGSFQIVSQSVLEADIIVFPEEGLFSTSYENDTWFISYAEDVPNPKIEHVNPCDDDKYQNSPILKRLSCMAKKHEFYVVADLIDVKKCEVTDGCDENDIDYCVTDPDECPEDGYYHFNTLVVFDREGYLITRYYKIHLYFEEGLNTPKTIKHEYFTTEFGEFTVGICFDLLFQGFVKSARNATGLVYPTWWFDHTPLIYFATSFQQSWSIANKVNILAADVQYPNFGSLGSGIYTPGNGALIYTSNPDARSKLLISNVPVSPIAIPVDTDLLIKTFITLMMIIHFNLSLVKNLVIMRVNVVLMF